METGSPKAKWFSGLLRNPKSLSLPPRIKYGVNSSGSPDVVPANAGNQEHKKLGSCFHRKPWIPAAAGMTKWK